MKRTLVLLALLCSAALLAGDQPLRDFQGPAGSGGGGNSTPVDVVNFPTDEDGNLLTVVPVANRVLDLLDTDLPLVDGEAWHSEVFSTGAFNWIAVQVTVNQNSGSSQCRVEWQLVPDDPWIDSTGAGNSSPNLVAVWAQASNVSSSRSALAQVQAPLARILCFSGGGLLTDLKVLLRRE